MFWLHWFHVLGSMGLPPEQCQRAKKLSCCVQARRHCSDAWHLLYGLLPGCLADSRGTPLPAEACATLSCRCTAEPAP